MDENLRKLLEMLKNPNAIKAARKYVRGGVSSKMGRYLYPANKRSLWEDEKYPVFEVFRDIELITFVNDPSAKGVQIGAESFTLDFFEPLFTATTTLMDPRKLKNLSILYNTSPERALASWLTMHWDHYQRVVANMFNMVATGKVVYQQKIQDNRIDDSKILDFTCGGRVPIQQFSYTGGSNNLFPDLKNPNTTIDDFISAERQMIKVMREKSHGTLFNNKSDLIVPVHESVWQKLESLAGIAKEKNRSLFKIESVEDDGLMLNGVLHIPENSTYEMWEPKDDNSGLETTKYDAIPVNGMKMIDRVHSGNEFVNCKVETMKTLGQKRKAEVMRITAVELPHEAGIEHLARTAPLATINPRGIGEAIIQS